MFLSVLIFFIPGAAEGGAGADTNKSVMFSDGIRPGGDLTELDGRPEGHRWEETSQCQG
mgnify:FL=1